MAVKASEELLGQRDDDTGRASHVAESVHVLVLGHLADEFGAIGAQASDSVFNAFDCKHDAPEAQRVRRRDRRFDLDQFWIAKLCQLNPFALQFSRSPILARDENFVCCFLLIV
jgi:hypothetical protein